MVFLLSVPVRYSYLLSLWCFCLVLVFEGTAHELEPSSTSKCVYYMLLRTTVSDWYFFLMFRLVLMIGLSKWSSWLLSWWYFCLVVLLLVVLLDTRNDTPDWYFLLVLVFGGTAHERNLFSLIAYTSCFPDWFFWLVPKLILLLSTSTWVSY